MADIVNQLQCIYNPDGCGRCTFCLAKAEIERLRAEVASLTQQCDEYSDEIGNCRVLEWRELADQLAETLRLVDRHGYMLPLATNEAVTASLAAYEAARQGGRPWLTTS